MARHVVVATWIIDKRFGYYCMGCHKSHWYGCAGKYHNRVEYRVNHCPVAGYESVEVHITVATERVKT